MEPHARVKRQAGPRVVLLGASNITYAFPRLAEGLLVSRGCEVFAAHGHGRSLGLRSSVFWRDLPGILDCGIWDALQAFDVQAPAARVALLTDVGNDLLYGVTPETIEGWLTTCLARLEQLRYETVVTSLPLESVARMTAMKFVVARTVLFPDCRLTWDYVREVAFELDARIRELAQRSGVKLIVPESHWYATDPIHIRQTRQRAAFEKLLGQWDSVSPMNLHRFPWNRAHFWWSKHPALRWIRRFPRSQPQPVWRGPQGNRLWLY